MAKQERIARPKNDLALTNREVHSESKRGREPIKASTLLACVIRRLQPASTWVPSTSNETAGARHDATALLTPVHTGLAPVWNSFPSTTNRSPHETLSIVHVCPIALLDQRGHIDKLSALQERLGMAHTSRKSMRMKDRLTVTVDAELAAHARQVAHKRGTSVSGLLETLLREALASRPRRSLPFADRWSGRFSVTPNTSGEARLSALKAKHSLE